MIVGSPSSSTRITWILGLTEALRRRSLTRLNTSATSAWIFTEAENVRRSVGMPSPYLISGTGKITPPNRR